MKLNWNRPRGLSGDPARVLDVSSSGECRERPIVKAVKKTKNRKRLEEERRKSAVQKEARRRAKFKKKVARIRAEWADFDERRLARIAAKFKAKPKVGTVYTAKQKQSQEREEQAERRLQHESQLNRN